MMTTRLALIALLAAFGAAHAQAPAAPPGASAASAPSKRAKLKQLAAKRRAAAASEPRSNNPASPRNTGLGATGDGSGADLTNSKKGTGAPGK